ncbi:MAG: PAS domain S-box protein, partial [Planctomycetaceae bacterium]|nr:PAS domain S-box protein [Planctomycetaceae bacterium]
MNILMLAGQTPENLRLQRELRDAAFGPHTVKHVATRAEAVDELEHLGIEALVMELAPDAAAPLDELQALLSRETSVPVIALIDQAGNPLALEALRMGAQDVLAKDRLTGESLSRAARYALERTLLSRELRERDEQYRRIVETAEEGIWTIDAHDRTVFANRKMTELVGYTLEEMIGKTPLDFMDDEARAIAIPRLAAKRKGEIATFEMCYRRKDGNAVWTSITTNPTFDERGRYQGAMALVTDISERREKEEALHRLVALVESSADAIISVDLDGKVLSWNQAAGKLYGYSTKEAIGRSIRFIVPPDRQIEMDQILTRVRKGEPVPTFDTVRKHQDGHAVPVSVGISPILDARGRLVAASAIVRDISSQQKLQDQFRQAQKMEAVGRLAGGVAHDFNNLLTVICGYASLLLTRNGEATSMKEEIEEINRAGERAASLTRQLLAFSRKQVLEPQIISLNPVLKDLEKMLRRLIGEDIQLSTVLQEDLGKVKVDVGQMEQVVMNLVINARDAMPHGGRLIIETRNVVLESGTVGAALELRAGAYVVLSVSDTGVGMTKEIQSHLFEPFYTTKGVGKGTGLGLSTLYGIVRQSGGHVAVYSEPGKGSCFKIYLPNTTASAQMLPAVKPKVGTEGGTESILVVEDNEMVRKLTCEVLTRKGYRVRSVGSAEDALKSFEHDLYPDLLLTDMVLAGMNGLDLCRSAARQKCGLRRLLMTGYTEEAMLHQGV